MTGWFGEKRETKAATKEFDHATYYAKLAVQQQEAVAEAEKQVAPRKDALAQEYLEEHTEDAGIFSLKAIRRGDFLTLSITRLAHRQPSIIDPDQSVFGPRTAEHNINLSLVNSVDLSPGLPPAWMGSLRYFIQQRSDASGQSMSVSPIQPAPDGYTMTAHAGIKSSGRGSRKLYVVPKKKDDPDYEWWDSDNIHMSNGSTITTPNWPMPATDDLLHFRGINSVLHTPFGMGESAKEIIMAAIEKGSSGKPKAR